MNEGHISESIWRGLVDDQSPIDDELGSALKYLAVV